MIENAHNFLYNVKKKENKNKKRYLLESTIYSVEEGSIYGETSI